MSTLIPINFFTDDIAIIPHYSTKGKWINKPVTIRQFSEDAALDGYPMLSLYKIEETGELVVKAISRNKRHFQFIEGAEVQL